MKIDNLINILKFTWIFKRPTIVKIILRRSGRRGKGRGGRGRSCSRRKVYLIGVLSQSDCIRVGGERTFSSCLIKKNYFQIDFRHKCRKKNKDNIDYLHDHW